jgi:endonuclease G
MIKHLVTTLTLFLLSQNVFADCESKYFKGVPNSSIELRKLCRKEYSVLYSDHCKIPYVVAEHLKSSEIGGTGQRQKSFKEDEEIPDLFRATLSDYSGRRQKKIDIGHMAPAANFTTDKETMEESFLLSNTVPQYEKMNRGVWKMLEMRVRALSQKYGEVYVLTGVLVEPYKHTIGSGVCIPTHMYKVIYVPKLNETVSYLIPNKNDLGKVRFQDYVTSVIEIEHQSGFTFFPQSKSALIKETGKMIEK